jgi:hypothetical protein
MSPRILYPQLLDVLLDLADQLLRAPITTHARLRTSLLALMIRVGLDWNSTANHIYHHFITTNSKDSLLPPSDCLSTVSFARLSMLAIS